MPVLKPFAAVVFAVLVMSAALAGERPLTGDEIRAALSGNTVEGVQDGVDWKQYFDPNGQTTYVCRRPGVARALGRARR